MQSNVKRLHDGVIVLVALLMVALYVAAAGGEFPLDDSWIHQTYGRNLAVYGDWAYRPGVASAASTSPLYTVVLAAGYKLGVPFHWWTHGLGALMLALAGLIGARLAARLAPKQKYVPLAAGLALVTAWHLIWAGASGMETMLFGMFTLLLIWLAWRELDPRSQTVQAIVLRGAIFGVTAALTTLTRPEGVMLVGFVGLALLVVRPNMTWRNLFIWGGAAVICFLLVLAPYLIYNYRLTGGLLPNTAAAKRAEGAPYFERSLFWRLENVTRPLLAGGQALLIPGMIAYLLMLPRERRSLLYLLLPLWGVALIVLYAVTLPLEYQHGRYVIPALPALIVAGVVGTGWLLRATRTSLIGRVVVRVVAGTAAVLFVVFAFGLGLQAYVQDVAIINQEMVATALWIKDNIPPDELVATHDIGAIGYFTDRPILDIAGLVDPEAIPLVGHPDELWDFMQSRDVRYLMALDNQVPGGDLTDPRLCEVFNTHGEAALGGGPGASNMKVYALAWDGNCAAIPVRQG